MALNKTLSALTILGLLSTSTFAATSGTLLLQGTVAQELSLAVNAVSGVNDALDLSASPSDLLVATVDENSNSNTGYKIQISSANAGLLKNGSLDQLAYTLKYDGSAVTLSSSAQDAKTVSTAGVYNVSSNVQISYTGKAATAMVEGTYSDTLTISIVAN